MDAEKLLAFLYERYGLRETNPNVNTKELQSGSVEVKGCWVMEEILTNTQNFDSKFAVKAASTCVV